MTADPVPADAETTTLIKRVPAPLPPYASAGTEPPAPIPMSPLAPTPPPARSAATDPAPAPVPAPGAAGPEPQSMADAMLEISRPPLAAPTDFAPAPVAASDASPGSQQEAPMQTLTEELPVAAVEPARSADVVPAPTVLPAPATTTAAVMPPPATDVITCPECGTTAQVTLNRRESLDFCRTCDYPLFWTPSKVLRDPSDTSDQSLRRLPGQAGRATVASLPCPFCYEPNALSAQNCLRCGRPMHPVEEPPPPAPVYIAPPAPVVVAPQQKVAWWVWALLALGAAAVIVLVVLIATHTIG